MRIGSDAEYEVGTSCGLGKGGFGVVVKGRHRATGRTVAIKSLRPPADDPVELQQEARLLLDASRGNPYVVGFHGLVQDRATGALRLAMEYAGPSLRAVLWERSERLSVSKVPEATVRAFMWQLLTGASTMHERGIVHRDIKPSNVLVGEDGTVRLCDLGLAMYLATEPMPYCSAGTPCYKAPEALMGKPDYDARVDTWSLGCVMAQMLTGTKLFDSDVNEVDQLWTIFGVLGMPDDETWPGFSSLPLADVTMRWPLYEQKKLSRLGELFSDDVRLSRDGFEVLEGLLACNPDRRLTAAAVLELPWFVRLDAYAAAELVVLALPCEKTIPPPATPKKKNMLKKVPLEIWNALRTATRSKTHGTYKRLSNL
ncbi:putative cyclin-dependent kinase F-2 [Lolium perenne]|uniref:putative cyclin-dependent kinase F-2 n=1 Tax=Lolium perenne TaxID=4522 RepID=UPI0021F65B78|nr:putative cyclin-dependent kinase F-2 [Lolium perenne]